MLTSLQLVLALGDPPFFTTANRFQRGLAPDTSRPKFFTAVHDGQSLVVGDAEDGQWRPALLSADDAEAVLSEGGCLEAILGTVDESSDSPLPAGDYWLLETSHLDEAPPLGASAGAIWQPLRAAAGPSVCDGLESDEAALLATARGMAHWHRSVRFCASCGSADLEPYRDGKGLRCASCGTRFRPRPPRHRRLRRGHRPSALRARPCPLGAAGRAARTGRGGRAGSPARLR